MKEINKQHDQLSGHLGIIAVPLNNIKSIQGSNIEYYNPDLNYQLNCSRESISYSCSLNLSKAGASYEHLISAFVYGYSPANNLFIEEMSKYQFVLHLQNAEGTNTLIGDLSKGVAFSYNFSSFSDPNGQIGYSITFRGVTSSAMKL